MQCKALFTLCTVPYVDARTWTHGNIQHCASTCVRHRTAGTDGPIRRHRKLQMLNYLLLTIVVSGHNCVVQRCSVCVNAALDINMLDYNIAIHSVNGV